MAPVAFAPVDDGVAAIRSILPDAHITSGYRSPDNPLSRANPNSWHTKSHAAVDIAPMNGLDFAGAVQRIRQAGYGLIESRDEQAHPLPWTTGPNWHFVLGKGR